MLDWDERHLTLCALEDKYKAHSDRPNIDNDWLSMLRVRIDIRQSFEGNLDEYQLWVSKLPADLVKSYCNSKQTDIQELKSELADHEKYHPSDSLWLRVLKHKLQLFEKHSNIIQQKLIGIL